MNAYSLTAGMDVEHTSGLKGRVVNSATFQRDGEFLGSVDIDDGNKKGLRIDEDHDAWADDGWTVLNAEVPEADD